MSSDKITPSSTLWRCKAHIDIDDIPDSVVAPDTQCALNHRHDGPHAIGGHNRDTNRGESIWWDQ